MTDRGPVTRCSVRGCVFFGHYAGYDGRCPAHRGSEWDDAHPPDIATAWVVDEQRRTGRG